MTRLINAFPLNEFPSLDDKIRKQQQKMAFSWLKKNNECTVQDAYVICAHLDLSNRKVITALMSCFKTNEILRQVYFDLALTQDTSKALNNWIAYATNNIQTDLEKKYINKQLFAIWSVFIKFGQRVSPHLSQKLLGSSDDRILLSQQTRNSISWIKRLLNRLFGFFKKEFIDLEQAIEKSLEIASPVQTTTSLQPEAVTNLLTSNSSVVATIVEPCLDNQGEKAIDLEPALNKSLASATPTPHSPRSEAVTNLLTSNSSLVATTVEPCLDDQEEKTIDLEPALDKSLVSATPDSPRSEAVTNLLKSNSSLVATTVEPCLDDQEKKPIDLELALDKSLVSATSDSPRSEADLQVPNNSIITTTFEVNLDGEEEKSVALEHAIDSSLTLAIPALTMESSPPVAVTNTPAPNSLVVTAGVEPSQSSNIYRSTSSSSATSYVATLISEALSPSQEKEWTKTTPSKMQEVKLSEHNPELVLPRGNNPELPRENNPELPRENNPVTSVGNHSVTPPGNHSVTPPGNYSVTPPGNYSVTSSQSRVRSASYTQGVTRTLFSSNSPARFGITSDIGLVDSPNIK